jgi:hypothetical protein
MPGWLSVTQRWIDLPQNGGDFGLQIETMVNVGYRLIVQTRSS